MTVLHYAVESEMFGPYETETRACCGNDFRRTKKLTDDPDKVTCRTCRELCGFPDAAAEYAELTEVHGDPLLGDCPLGTVATRASPRAPAGLGHSASVNYRKDEAA